MTDCPNHEWTYLQSIKSVKHNAANSVDKSILKKSLHWGSGVFIVHSPMCRDKDGSLWTRNSPEGRGGMIEQIVPIGNLKVAGRLTLNLDSALLLSLTAPDWGGGGGGGALPSLSCKVGPDTRLEFRRELTLGWLIGLGGDYCNHVESGNSGIWK
jgi:hypothetical protein